MADTKARRDTVVEAYGPAYKDYGWAAGLEKPNAPKFRDFEELAKVSHLRGHYSWASPEVHSDARGYFKAPALSRSDAHSVVTLDPTSSVSVLPRPVEATLLSAIDVRASTGLVGAARTDW